MDSDCKQYNAFEMIGRKIGEAQKLVFIQYMYNTTPLRYEDQYLGCQNISWSAIVKDGGVENGIWDRIKRMNAG